MRVTPLIIILAIAATMLAAGSGFPSSGTEYRLLNLRQEGKCTELPHFGVSTHRGRNSDDINVKLVSDIQAGAIRFDIPWIDVEHDGKYDFGAYDNLMRTLREKGKSIVLLLAYGHPDHSDGVAQSGIFPLPPRTSEQRAAFSKYAQEVAKRYHGPDITYEIWNEPNLALFWPPVPDAKAYGELAAAAAQAIRKSEPTATIISGGLANENNPPAFMRVVADSGALALFNGISFHPYRQNGPENSLHDIAEFENAATGRGNLPLWLTEWGYSESWLAKINPDGVRQRSAVMTARMMLTAALAKAKALLVYDLIDDGANANDPESNFGLYDFDFKPKPAATVFRKLAGLMSGCSRYEFKADAAQNLIVAAFYSDGEVSNVIWTYTPSPSGSSCFATEDARPVLEDIFGNHLPFERCGDGSHVRLKISEALGPVILHSSR